MKVVKNVKEGKITTIAGLLIIAGSIASVFVLKMSWTEASIGAGLGIGLITMGKK